jgi:hypothetical protein
MGGDIDFKVISAAKNSNKFQKTRIQKGPQGNTQANNGIGHTSGLEKKPPSRRRGRN